MVERDPQARRWPRHKPAWGVFITFNVVYLAWILFRSDFPSPPPSPICRASAAWPRRHLLTPFIVTLMAGGLAMHWLPR